VVQRDNDIYLKSFDLGSTGIADMQNSLNLRQFEEQTKSIASMTTQYERRFALYLSLTCPVVGDINEVGSWVGGITCFLAKGCQLRGKGIVNAIDHFKGNVGKEESYSKGLEPGESAYDRFLKNIRLADVDNCIRVWKMNSAQARDNLNDPVRIVFIDGDHEYQSVRDEILRWEPLLKSGGFLALHDFSNAFPGVIRAAKETILQELYGYFLLVDSLLIAQKK